MLLYKSYSVESEPFREPARFSSASGRNNCQARSNCGDGKPKEGKMSKDKQYLVNLTDNLIAKNGYDRLSLSRPVVREFIFQDLAYGGDVFKMSSTRLGEIMGTFETGDVIATRNDLFGLIHFSGDCKSLLCELVAACLAYYIDSRLNDNEPHITPYRRRQTKYKTA